MRVVKRRSDESSYVRREKALNFMYLGVLVSAIKFLDTFSKVDIVQTSSLMVSSSRLSQQTISRVGRSINSFTSFKFKMLRFGKRRPRMFFFKHRIMSQGESISINHHSAEFYRFTRRVGKCSIVINGLKRIPFATLRVTHKSCPASITLQCQVMTLISIHQPRPSPVKSICVIQLRLATCFYHCSGLACKLRRKMRPFGVDPRYFLINISLMTSSPSPFDLLWRREKVFFIFCAPLH